MRHHSPSLPESLPGLGVRASMTQTQHQCRVTMQLMEIPSTMSCARTICHVKYPSLVDYEDTEGSLDPGAVLAHEAAVWRASVQRTHRWLSNSHPVSHETRSVDVTGSWVDE